MGGAAGVTLEHAARALNPLRHHTTAAAHPLRVDRSVARSDVRPRIAG